MFPSRLSRIRKAFFRIHFFFTCNTALLICDSPALSGGREFTACVAPYAIALPLSKGRSRPSSTGYGEGAHHPSCIRPNSIGVALAAGGSARESPERLWMRRVAGLVPLH